MLGGRGFQPIHSTGCSCSAAPGNFTGAGGGVRGRGGESVLTELHWNAAPTLSAGGMAAPALWMLPSTPGTPGALCAGTHGHAHPGPRGLSAAARLCLAWSPRALEALLLLGGGWGCQATPGQGCSALFPGRKVSQPGTQTGLVLSRPVSAEAWGILGPLEQERVTWS